MICSPLQQTVSLKPTIDTLNKWYPERNPVDYHIGHLPDKKRDAKMWCTDDHFHACRIGDRKRNLKEPRLQTASLLDRFGRNTACQESE